MAKWNNRPIGSTLPVGALAQVAQRLAQTAAQALRASDALKAVEENILSSNAAISAHQAINKVHLNKVAALVDAVQDVRESVARNTSATDSLETTAALLQAACDGAASSSDWKLWIAAGLVAVVGGAAITYKNWSLAQGVTDYIAKLEKDHMEKVAKAVEAIAKPVAKLPESDREEAFSYITYAILGAAGIGGLMLYKGRRRSRSRTRSKTRARTRYYSA